MDFSDVAKNLYYLLLMLSAILYLASFFYGVKKFLPITICLCAGAICELFYELVNNDIVLIFGEKNNTVFAHFYDWISFFTLSYFLITNIKSLLFKRIFVYMSLLAIALGLAFQLQLDPYLFKNDPWLPFPLMIAVIIMSVFSLYELLKRIQGFPYITIGIFLMSGNYLITSSVSGAYINVDLDVWYFRVFVFRIVWIMTYLLFIYELLLFFKKRKKENALSHNYE